jgi:hypothetical protein
MADSVVHIGQNSPEEVAYKLLHLIANAESISLHENGRTKREWILSTYYSCLRTVKGHTPTPPAQTQR